MVVHGNNHGGIRKKMIIDHNFVFYCMNRSSLEEMSLTRKVEMEGR
ncbi:hypothetical protein HanXRQr2_Chr15g0689401 [Helianthus annuus]|uniref:Uncharacterized protein n=1 Tax=Helianthus annuus TaxID=4232 RepID=A0A9K3E1H2_HELAN|nr:hypothetical protein HanXRQr2_Chr15g0689401 [Helianthus annuus]KAJ0830943.1 hypothetical protein HanPSC8_Chr15g0661261 [Helianthus annuus]